MAKIIDGRAVADKIRNTLAQRAKEFSDKNGRKCGLAVILVGKDPASEIYVKNKAEACNKIGVLSFVHRLGPKATQVEVLSLVEKLNESRFVDGILVQLPLPKQIDERTVLESILPEKDVDGFCITNVGKLLLNHPCVVPCTALAVLELIKTTGVSLPGAHAVVVGRSNIVGKPTGTLLLGQDCTVTQAHAKTRNLGELTRMADVLVVATGKKHLIKRDMVKPGAVVIDVGITREGKKIYGDVDFENVKEVAGWITPVPGGVGPVTIAMLLKNALKI